MAFDVDISVVNDDVLTHKCDVLGLKYAQGNYGVDTIVSELLVRAGHRPSEMQPRPGGYRFLQDVQVIPASCVSIGVISIVLLGSRLNH